MTKKPQMVKSFKAKITTTRPHFIKKVLIHQTSVKDAFKPSFRSFISIFIPKLTPEYKRSCIMLHISNGSGSCLIRLNDPIEMANHFLNLSNYLRSNKFLSDWDYINDLSEKLQNLEPILNDPKFLDLEQFEKSEKYEKLLLS